VNKWLEIIILFETESLCLYQHLLSALIVNIPIYYLHGNICFGHRMTPDITWHILISEWHQYWLSWHQKTPQKTMDTGIHYLQSHEIVSWTDETLIFRPTATPSYNLLQLLPLQQQLLLLLLQIIIIIKIIIVILLRHGSTGRVGKLIMRFWARLPLLKLADDVHAKTNMFLHLSADCEQDWW